MSEPEHVTLTVEQYEALLAQKAKPTIVVDAAEYNALLAFKAANAKASEENVRVIARLRELEMLLRREQQEHAAEIAEMTKQLAHPLR